MHMYIYIYIYSIYIYSIYIYICARSIGFQPQCSSLQTTDHGAVQTSALPCLVHVTNNRLLDPTMFESHDVSLSKNLSNKSRPWHSVSPPKNLEVLTYDPFCFQLPSKRNLKPLMKWWKLVHDEGPVDPGTRVGPMRGQCKCGSWSRSILTFCNKLDRQ